MNGAEGPLMKTGASTEAHRSRSAAEVVGRGLVTEAMAHRTKRVIFLGKRLIGYDVKSHVLLVLPIRPSSRLSTIVGRFSLAARRNLYDI